MNKICVHITTAFEVLYKQLCKKRITLTFFVLVPGQVNRNFSLVLNEMGPALAKSSMAFLQP